MKKLKILIPTDFSVQAEYAYLMVKKLAEKAEVETHFLHVLNVPDTVTMDAQGHIQTCGEIDINYVISQKEIAERKLNQLKTLYGADLNVKLLLGKTTDTILEFAEKADFDLIVMGTKGAWGMKEKISGSETQQIARKSKVPVLSLMCDRSNLDIKNILLVHNFYEKSYQLPDLLHKLINTYQPKIHFLQITTDLSDGNVAQIQSIMKSFALTNQLAEVEMHILKDSDVENGVIHFSQMNQVDIICIGTHGKGGLFHNSAAEKLINHMFKPIISFHLN
ncbi:MAG: universal stress protein [Flavobacteriales bacterium]